MRNADVGKHVRGIELNFGSEKPPQMAVGLQHFSWSADDPSCGIEWRMWKRSFEIFARARHIVEDDKLAWMLFYAGPKVQRVFDNLPAEIIQGPVRFGPLVSGYICAQQTEYEKATKQLDEFYAPKRSNTYERHLFRKLKQRTNERIDVYLMRLRCQAERCNFGNQEDDNIKDQLTEGCSSEEIRRKILLKGEESLSDIVNMIRIEETVALQQKLFKPEESGRESMSDVCKIEIPKGKYMKNRAQPYFNRNRILQCSRCGFNGHKGSDEKCPAKGKRCNKCNGVNHFARKCLTNSDRERKQLNDDTNKEPPVLPTREEAPVNLVENSYDFKYYDDVLCIE